ncbi:hypothetical protein FSP39_015993 [Pinctada imbricata]|uniref:B box-type domain-containing protein n=1 Tax=Pinctada imbricata TaxID=66713 RepID=A0AA89C3M4_PINIB|nr:hypothetical protein FSP39_015993 [Pinctada imbricata]
MSDEGEFYPAQSVINCDFCDTHVNVTWVCHTCDVSICQKCKDIHLGKKKFRDHKVRLRGEEKLVSPIRTTKCHKHSSIDYTAFCDRCKIPACIKCLVSEHKDHHVLDLKEAFDEYRVQLRSLKENYKSQKLSEIPKRRVLLQQEKERINTESSMALDQIEKERAEAITSLNKVYNKLKNDVKLAKESQQKDVEEKSKALNKNENSIEHLLEQCDTHEASRDISIFKFVIECPHSVDFPPNEVSVGQIKFVSRSVSLSNIEQIVGKVMTNSKSDNENKTRSSEKNIPAVDNKITQSFMAPLSENEFSKGASVIQYEKSNHVWMTNDYSSTLYLYNSQGSKVTSISAGFEIFGFDMDGNGDFIATDYDNKKVKNITRSGKVTIVISSLPSEPLGVCVNNKQEIVLCLYGSNALSKYSPDGRRLVRKIGEGGRLFMEPRRLTQNGNQDYCVVDDYKRVVVVDVGGSHRWTYDGQQGEKFNPDSTACDGYQCLVISDYNNHKIHLVDKDGHFLQVLLTREAGIEYPRGVCADKDGKLWVGQKDGEVHVVKYRSK